MSASGATPAADLNSRHCFAQESQLGGVLLACLAKAKSWRVPPAWSVQNWFEELEQLTQIAAWQALRQFDTQEQTSCEAFIYHTVLQRVLASHRRECTHGHRFISGLLNVCPDKDDDDESGSRTTAVSEEAATDPPPHHLLVREALELLPAAQRLLIEELFWAGRTEQELGKMLGLSQRAVSRLKHAALQNLRQALMIANEAAEDSLTLSV